MIDEQSFLRSLHDLLDHHGKTRAEHVERFERACELQALAVLCQVETLGPTGTAVPLANALERVLKSRGVLP